MARASGRTGKCEASPEDACIFLVHADSRLDSPGLACKARAWMLMPLKCAMSMDMIAAWASIAKSRARWGMGLDNELQQTRYRAHPCCCSALRLCI